MKRFIHMLLFLLIGMQKLMAQEHVVPIGSNRSYEGKTMGKPSKKVRASLPFIDDFSYEGPYPDPNLWVDNKVYINNTMSATPITRGLATFDGLNEFGRPYFPQPFNSGLADSLTSVPINLAGFTAADDLFLSFFYQPQGLGFAPESGDSLFLYFKNNANQWIRAWQTKGTPIQGFKIVVLPVDDAQFLHADFQFRFINIASLSTNDDVWNIDYVKLDKNRNIDDTVMKDMAFTTEAGSILNNYSAMPYRHFLTNQAGEKSASHDIIVRNLYLSPQTIVTNIDVQENISSTPIYSNALSSVSVASNSIKQQSFLSYPISYVAPSNKSRVVIRNKYFFPPVNANDRRSNDTLVKDVVFDNYFAYDDGSAEKSYFLLAASNFPAKTALKFTLNEPDTIRGLMVHFGAQAPTALGKYFSIVLYQSLGAGMANDSIIIQDDLFQVQYEPSYNGFSTYAFSQAKLLNAGTYYIGITQPANFGSDSIYYGLDVNTNTSSSTLAYNVDGTWYSSGITGSLMMRPMVGQSFTPTGVSAVKSKPQAELVVYPNPVSSNLYLESKEKFTSCTIMTLDGAIQGILPMNEGSVSLSHLKEGEYLLVFKDHLGRAITKKIYKK